MHMVILCMKMTSPEIQYNYQSIFRFLHIDILKTYIPSWKNK